MGIAQCAVTKFPFKKTYLAILTPTIGILHFQIPGILSSKTMSNVKRHHVYNHAALFSITKAWPAEPFHTRVQAGPPEKPEHFTGMPKSMKARIKMQGNKQKAQHSGVPVKAVCRYENHEQFLHLPIRCCEVCERAPTLENCWHAPKKTSAVSVVPTVPVCHRAPHSALLLRSSRKCASSDR